MSVMRGAPVSLERAISKLGIASRSVARGLIEAGRVRVDGTVRRDPALRVDMDRAHIEVDGERAGAAARVYIALNKPRGLVTTVSDERGRPTVYDCLDASLPRVVPVGRLDLESEGLLLLTNDTRWAHRVVDPASHVDKRYRVFVDRALTTSEIDRLVEGVDAGRGETLSAVRVEPLRGASDRWYEIVLDEGKNRQIRRMLDAIGVGVERLVRVAIGSLELGSLAPGEWRHLTPDEVRRVDPAPQASGGRRAGGGRRRR